MNLPSVLREGPWKDVGNLCDDLNEAREDVAQLMQEVHQDGSSLVKAPTKLLASCVVNLLVQPMV